MRSRKLQRAIEFHDTTVAGITKVGEQVILFLRAYVHQSEGRPGWDAGSGWVQAAALTFTGAKIEGGKPDLPADIWHGELNLDGNVSANDLPIPFHYVGEITLTLQIGAPNDLVVHGTGATLTMLGEAEYVEEYSGSGNP